MEAELSSEMSYFMFLYFVDQMSESDFDSDMFFLHKVW